MTDAGSGNSGGTPRRGLHWARARVIALVVLGGVALALPIVALPAAFLLFVGWLSLPPSALPNRRAATAALGVAALAALGGVVRFLVEVAPLGIVRGGQVATEKRAISRLREVVFAEDALRRHGLVDPDGDHVGSAGLLGELTGAVALRGGAKLAVPILSPEFAPRHDTPQGPAAEVGGYLYLVCLPTGEGFTGQPTEPVDEERAEREYLAYAWPAAARPGFDAVLAIDARERILVGRPRPPAALPFVGPERPPPCAASLTDDGPLAWEAWENKPPRRQLPGDRG